ncbi:chromosome partitioning protein ParA [Vibrio sinaloensis]|uniref:chromosome partitioning protein ParA n=1 Tax=Photobacterium sp. (strain ATCC 43367) TaxID=379097 RepID=UPI00206C1E3B|nr:chromosome partitioning protein ParA [Vibrio sinaloensis]UPQ86910.1 chromosome partitioning protein ParA [Vibrio sinaloensis]
MNQQTDNQDNEDVVVIEERDNKTLLYIVIAGVLGVALGGLLGSTLTAQKWQSTYLELEQQYQTLTKDKQQLVVKVEQKVAEVDNEIEQKLQQAIVDQQAEHKSEIEALQQQLQELEKVNLSLEQQLGEQKQQLESATAQNSRLNRQADMQATMFERSRELFQQELKVKQQLEALEQEREELGPRIEELKKACDLYLEGTSWEAKSDSCDKQDEASSRLSQVEQMIRVHQLDLKQIDALSEELGL